MIIYLAGWEAAKSLMSENVYKKVTYVLTTYFYNQKFDLFKKWKEEGKKIFLDSGAFSAYTQNQEVNLNTYCDFIKQVEPFLETYVVLDDIRGAKQTFENQKKMEDRGLNPIPCFHYGEKMKLLDWYAKRYDYIALGGMMKVKMNPKLMNSWFEYIFEKYPEHKFHGFGMTNFSFIKKFRWYSVDSTSWTQGSKFGRIQMLDGNVLNFSHGVDYSVKHPEIRRSITRILENQGINISIEELTESHILRNDVNVLTFLSLMEELTKNIPPIFKSKQHKLF